MIETDRLIIRRFTEGDALSFFQNVHSDPFIYLYVDDAMSTSLAQTQEYIHDRMQYADRPFFFDYCIVRKDTLEVIGEINASYRKKENVADIGYIISSAVWGKGYATEAVEGFLSFLFAQGIQTVIGACEVENIASQRVMEKNGMHRLLVVREAFQKMEDRENLLYFEKSKGSA